MFGCVTADPARLNPAEQGRYRACYCGLCRSLRREYGKLSRLCLSYDMTFLILLLNSLYEQDELCGQERCLVHPVKPHDYWQAALTDYAAAMNALLFYYKCLDDWQDERKLSRLLLAGLFRGAKRKAAAAYPRQTAAIEASLSALSRLEAEKAPADALCREFGNLMGELFVYEQAEHFAPVLRAFGQKLGAYIYLLDAVCDLEDDRKKGCFNPLSGLGEAGTYFKPHLTLLLGDAAAELEKLPLLRDINLLRNIVYSGVWSRYEQQFEKKEARP